MSEQVRSILPERDMPYQFFNVSPQSICHPHNELVVTAILRRKSAYLLHMQATPATESI